MLVVIVVSYLLGVLVLLWLGWLLSLLLHESGHALAALLLTAGPVAMYLGSHGQPGRYLSLRLGRLQVHARYNLLRWGGGLCQYELASNATGRRRLIVLAGPLLPLLVAPVVLRASFQQDNGVLRLLSILFLLVVILSDLLLSLLPSGQAITLADGRQLHNDGYQLWRRPALPDVQQLYAQASALLSAGQYAESAEAFQLLLPRVKFNPEVLRQAMQAYMLTGNYPDALRLSSSLLAQAGEALSDNDRFQHGLLLSLTDQPAAALAAYTALLHQPAPYLPAYSNRGYTYNLLGEHTLALADFDYLLALNPDDAYARSNRGLALLRLGQPAAALAELQAGAALDASIAYVHLNLGIYHFEQANYAAALSCFEQAHMLNPYTHQLASYQQQTRQHLGLVPDAGG